jgi:hypothetical protein
VARGALAALVALGLGASVAFAVQTANVTLSKPVAGKATHITIDIKGEDPAAGGQVPRSIAVKAVRGLKVDSAAVAKLCSRSDAQSDNCPSESRIGGGNAVIYASGPFISPKDYTATADLFLAKPAQTGDIAGVVARFSLGGFSVHVIGRIIRIPSGPLGVETLFDKLDSQAKPPAGYTAKFKSLHLTFGAGRSVKKKSKKHKKHRKKVRHDLIRNPSTCGGSWPWEVLVRYPNAYQKVIDGSVACKSR